MGNHRKSMRLKPFRPCYPSANKHNHWNYNRVHWVHHLCPLTRVIQKQYKSAQFLPSSVQLQTATTAFTAHIINTARAGAIVGTWLVDWSHHTLESSQPSQLYIYIVVWTYQYVKPPTRNEIYLSLPFSILYIHRCSNGQGLGVTHTCIRHPQWLWLWTYCATDSDGKTIGLRGHQQYHKFIQIRS